MIIEVPAEAAGERLDVFLAEATGSRAKAQRLIEAGLRARGRRARQKRYVLLGGETIEFTSPGGARARAVPPAQFEIAYEDDRLIVVDKPAGVVVHPGVGNAEGTLVQALAGRVAGGNDPDRPGVVHRLDRDTSGLLLLARDERDVRGLQAALRARDITREYLALVEGRPPAQRGTIDAPLGRDRRVRTRIPPTPTIRTRRSRTSRSSARCPTTRCCGSRWRPAARTRSARICWRSDIPSRATRSTATRAGTGFPGNSCTPNDSRSITPKPGHQWSCGRHCRRTWSGPSGRRQGNERTTSV